METLLKKRRQELKTKRYKKARKKVEEAVKFLYRNGAKEVYLFGSITKPENFTEHSDIDIAIKGMPSEKHLEIEGNLEDILGNFEYDILFLGEDNIRKEILDKIEEGGVLWSH